MKLIDTHCHLYSNDFESDRDEVIRRAKNVGVSKFYLPSIDSKVLDEMMKMEMDYMGECFAMMGLHPCSVNAAYHEELRIIAHWLKQRKFVAMSFLYSLPCRSLLFG